MGNSQLKLCKVPGCKKEIYANKSLFCGEHERKFREYRKTAGKSTLGLSVIVIVFIANVKKKS
ncbi:hypothetical protein [Enterococcus mundtii]|uniref:hypothetical protein n=1 Tax=Enterococcus mundtii TaxID=53346 RepID=UPI000824A9A9|nr:hypothetical protein [Enterococcus mundtii]